MKEKTCCFTGHREIPKGMYPMLTAELERKLHGLIQRGFQYFGAGGALGFDTLAAEAVLRLKEQYPDIRLILVLPCPDQTRFDSLQALPRFCRGGALLSLHGVFRKIVCAPPEIHAWPRAHLLNLT